VRREGEMNGRGARGEGRKRKKTTEKDEAYEET